MRGLAIAVAVLLAAGAGLLAGYSLWGRPVAPTGRVEPRVQAESSELTILRQQKEELEQRLQQVNKEQERLAQENEILRKEHTTEQLLSGQGGELPARPPK